MASAQKPEDGFGSAYLEKLQDTQKKDSPVRSRGENVKPVQQA